MPKRSKEQGLQIFEQHTQSGLSVNPFCQQSGALHIILPPNIDSRWLVSLLLALK